MPSSLQAIRGMNDILPNQVHTWQIIEKCITELMAAYDYREIRFPIVEKTELFSRTIGEVTDIVEKEMYTFEDRNGDSLSLRPEGTACCVRAGIEHGLLYNQIQRLWYTGPMFRHERPQKGRYRQFYQLGVEAFGIAEPQIDAELIALSARLWKMLGLTDKIELQINSLGSVEARKHYREKLVEYYRAHINQLDEDSKRRLELNPLRILDSKNPAMQTLNTDAPKLLEFLDSESKHHFSELCRLLDALGIKHIINPNLVRGLDYYCKTVFEWVTNELGAQGTVCAGGRYNGLVEQLGGKPTPACGFAIGLERIALLLSQQQETNQAPHAYLVIVGEEAIQHGMLLAEKIHDELPHFHLLSNCDNTSFKSQFKRADKSGALIAIVLGNEEVENGVCSIKYLREDKPQETIALSDVIPLCSALISK